MNQAGLFLQAILCLSVSVIFNWKTWQILGYSSNSHDWLSEIQQLSGDLSWPLTALYLHSAPTFVKKKKWLKKMVKVSEDKSQMSL